MAQYKIVLLGLTYIWNICFVLKDGPAGNAGDKGDTGDDGQDGAQGADGIAGPDGVQMTKDDINTIILGKIFLKCMKK